MFECLIEKVRLMQILVEPLARAPSKCVVCVCVCVGHNELLLQEEETTAGRV